MLKVKFLLFAAAVWFDSCTNSEMEDMVGPVYRVLSEALNHRYQDETVYTIECWNTAMAYYTKINKNTGLVKYWPIDHPAPLKKKFVQSVQCPFSIPLGTQSLALGKKLVVENAVSWTCVIPEKSLCDGFSMCLTDECGCSADKKKSEGDEVFYCIEPPGCIIFPQVCNEIVNCYDMSDECFCQGFVRVICGNETVACLSPREFCFRHKNIEHECHTEPPIDCAELRPNGLFKNKMNPVYRCMMVKEDVPHSNDARLQEMCVNECGRYFEVENWGIFCKHIVTGSQMSFAFACNRNVHTSLGLDVICNGISDCMNDVDEIGCPGRFYCDPENHPTIWVDEIFRCDRVRQCPNGRDECEGCDFGVLTSSRALMKSLSLALGCFLAGVMTVILNLITGSTALREIKQSSTTRNKKTDAFLCLNIAVYDLLMGVYLCLIAATNFILRSRGDYCEISFEWRSSLQCDLLGILFSFSSHGSLLVISLMSIIRAIKCTFPFIDIRLRNVIILTVLLALLNIIHSVIPALRSKFLQEVFMSEIHLDNTFENPLVKFLDESHIRSIYEAYTPDHQPANLLEMLQRLRGITSKPAIFDYTTIGYYGSSSLCIQNIFKNQESYQTYKYVYCTSIAGILLTVICSYIMIIVQQVKSPQAEARALITKVCLIIGSQLISWVSLIATAVYYLHSESVPGVVFEVFALLVLPINSFLNPIFYSESLRIVYNRMMDIRANLSGIFWRQSVTEGRRVDGAELRCPGEVATSRSSEVEENAL